MNWKLCPLKFANGKAGDTCEGDNCACYIKLVKPRYMETERYRLIDPENFYRYTGCGLVTHIPWELVERKRKKPEDKQAEEAYAKLDGVRP